MKINIQKTLDVIIETSSAALHEADNSGLRYEANLERRVVECAKSLKFALETAGYGPQIEAIPR